MLDSWCDIGSQVQILSSVICLFLKKLDGIGPLITDPPPISFTTLFEEKKNRKINVTCDL